MISVRDLAVDIDSERGPIRVLDGVDLELGPGRSLALVGASGSGKSLTALALLGLLPRTARVVRGEIVLFGRALADMDAEALRALRGKRIAIVFQDPGGALNPIRTVGSQIAEAVRAHAAVTAEEAERRAVEMLARVELPEPERVARMWPHQLSGGMKQRAVIAMALVHGPEVLIADEATSSLDVTVQAQILALFAAARRASNMALLFITHDLALVHGLCEETAVMAGGRVVERASTERIFAEPEHELSRALVALSRERAP